MTYQDLRDWLQAVEARGEVKHISGASWELEMSSIAELVLRGSKYPKPLLLFDDIPGYPKGYRTSFGLQIKQQSEAGTNGFSVRDIIWIAKVIESI